MISGVVSSILIFRNCCPQNINLIACHRDWISRAADRLASKSRAPTCNFHLRKTLESLWNCPKPKWKHLSFTKTVKLKTLPETTPDNLKKIFEYFFKIKTFLKTRVNSRESWIPLCHGTFRLSSASNRDLQKEYQRDNLASRETMSKFRRSSEVSVFPRSGWTTCSPTTRHHRLDLVSLYRSVLWKHWIRRIWWLDLFLRPIPSYEVIHFS